MKVENKIFQLLLPLMLIACTPDPGPENNGGNGTGGNGGGTVELVPPDEVKSTNLFLIDFFSTLEDEDSFFTQRDPDSAVQHISGATGKLPVIYMFDRCDFVVGQENPMTKAAYRIGAWQFFSQIEPTALSVVKGTGILTRYVISDFDGIASEGVYMSGCVQPVPMKTTTAVCMYTTRIDSEDDIRTIAELKSQDLLGESVVVATVSNDVKTDVVKYIEDNMSLRASVYGSSETELDLLVIVPMSYVCRSIEKETAVNLPYYRVSIEKWLW